MSELDRPELQRLRYWQGQTLRSRDFRDQMAIEGQLRWWHNRALHSAFGVVEGFEVEPNVGEVMIRRGLAYDCFGRELILTADTPFSLPTESGMTLLARYRETRQFARKDEMTAACAPSHFSSEERPEFFWKQTDSVEIRDGVPLVRYQDAKLNTTRPSARPLARPHIASGATIPGNTAWELWRESGVREIEVPLGFQVSIDTSAAGFTEIPCYFAWLQGPLWTPQIDPDFFPVLFEHINSPSTTSFIFRIWMPPLITVLGDGTTNQKFESRFPEFARKRELFVCWLGIEAENEAGELKEVDHGIS